MNEFLFFVGLVVTTFLCAGTWCLIREVWVRWLNNDWCRHDWGMWEAVSEGRQYRFCKKCNKAERWHV